jgi:hypothetical protein
MAVCQPTPNSRATCATERPASPTRRQISARARSVSAARDPMSSTTSDHVPNAQSGSGQRHRRLTHTNTTGRSAIGRSRTITRLRPWPTARVPHPSQPTTSAVVSTISHSSPAASSCAPTTNSGIPSSTVAPSLRCFMSGASCSATRTSRRITRPPTAPVDPYRTASPTTRPHAPSRRAVNLLAVGVVVIPRRGRCLVTWLPGCRRGRSRICRVRSRVFHQARRLRGRTEGAAPRQARRRAGAPLDAVAHRSGA